MRLAQVSSKSATVMGAHAGGFATEGDAEGF